MKTADKKSKWAFSLGLASLISNLFMFTLSGAPISILFGILGIAFAIASKEESPTMSKYSKLGLIFSIIGLIFGFIFYALMELVYSVITDPAQSHLVIEYLEEMLKELPADMQEKFRSLYGL